MKKVPEADAPAARFRPARDAGDERPVRNEPRRPRGSMFRMRTPLSTSRFLIIAAAVFIGLLGLWWLATAQAWVKPLFLPSPEAVADRLVAQVRNGQLAEDVGLSAYRILLGFVIASAMAVPLGIIIGTYRFWEAAVEPLMDFVRYMPVVAFVPLTILWVGTSDVQKILVIWIGTFFQQVLMIMDSAKRVPVSYVEVGRTLGMKDRSILRRIVLPSAAPAIWDTLRITIGWAWTWVTLAELVAATSGLGYRITVAQRFFQTDLIIGYILVLGVLGLLSDQGMRVIGRVLFRYERVGR